MSLCGGADAIIALRTGGGGHPPPLPYSPELAMPSPILCPSDGDTRWPKYRKWCVELNIESKIAAKTKAVFGFWDWLYELWRFGRDVTR